MNEQEQLMQLCQRLGASPEQAATMSAQLLKRAGQLSAERGIARELALKALLEVLVKGRSGEVPENFVPPPPRPPHGGTSGM